MFDVNEIKQQFIEVIQYSQGIKEPKIDKLFDDWLEAKRDFIEALDGELRFCVPNVKFELSEDVRRERVKSFINHIDEDYNLYELASFISSNKEGFFDNKIEKIPLWMYNDGELNSQFSGLKLGMKLLRAFKFFIYDKAMLEQVQNEASMLIQEDKIEGNLYLSVHPLDFLSSSENTYNWRSCHALDGEYRCGNLSYMCDKSTVICYLAVEDKKLPRFPESVPWNSKKWRMLLHFSDNWDMIFAGRQYPFFSREALDIVTNKILINTKLSSANYYWSDWTNFSLTSIIDTVINEEMYITGRYIPVNGKLVKIEDIVQDKIGGKHYNDILHSSVYQPYYTKRRQKDSFNDIYDKVYVKGLKFHIGSITNCLHCGNHAIDLYGMMVCADCDRDYFYNFDTDEDYIICACCGNRYYLDCSYSIGDSDEYFCESCYQNYAGYCCRCGRNWRKDDLSYNKQFGDVICRLCEEDITFDE